MNIYEKVEIPEYCFALCSNLETVNIHNNLSLDHYLVDENRSYLISFRKSYRDFSIYDLINLYKKYYNSLDFCELIRRYEMYYPLLLEERMLFFVLISIPDKLEFDDNEYNMCIKVKNFYDYLFSSERLISDYLPKDTN